MLHVEMVPLFLKIIQRHNSIKDLPQTQTIGISAYNMIYFCYPEIISLLEFACVIFTVLYTRRTTRKHLHVYTINLM